MEIIITESQYKRLLKENSSNRINVYDMIFISYGTSEYDNEGIKPIPTGLRANMNLDWKNKPMGGLWSSPLKSKFGWSDFVKSDARNFMSNLEKHFIFKIKPSANIYILDNEDDFYEISTYQTSDGRKRINFAQLQQDYDGMFVTLNAVRKFHYSSLKYVGLDTWDVESLVVWNKDVVEQISENEFDKLKIELKNMEMEYDVDPFMEMYATDYPEEAWNVEDERNKNVRNSSKLLNRLQANQNINPSQSHLFNGKHPAILAQGDENDINTQRARRYNGTIQSGL